MNLDDNANIKVDISVLKVQIESITKLCDKMDKVIEKLAENQEKMVNQIYNDMREREDEKDRDVKELHSRITTISRELSDKVELTERRIMDEIKCLRHDIIEHNKKEDSELKKILEWKWMAAGGIVVLAWLLSNIPFDRILNIFK